MIGKAALRIVTIGLLAAASLSLRESGRDDSVQSATAPRWVVQSDFGSGAILQDATFVDQLRGVAAGMNGILLSTTDGGFTWRQLASGSADNLSTVRLGNDAYGTASGGGTVLRTLDGGLTWSRLPNGALPVGVLDAAAPAAHLVLIADSAGSDQGIYRSADDGVSWQQVLRPDAGMTVTRVVFPEPGNGWVCGSAGLLHSLDLGVTWMPVPVAIGNCLSLHVASPLVGYAGGILQSDGKHWSAVTALTLDGGARWSVLTIHAATTAAAVQLRDVAFSTDGRQGVAAVVSSLYWTEDGGSSWIRQSPPSASAPITAVGFRGSEAFAVAGGRFLHRGPLPLVPTATKVKPSPTASRTGTATRTPSPTRSAVPDVTPGPLAATATVAAAAPATASTARSTETATAPPLTASPNTSAETVSSGGLVAFSSATPLPARLETPIAPASLRLLSVSPAKVVAGSGARLSVLGMGFDAVATVSIGPVDIVDTRVVGALLQFNLPAALRPGSYTLIISEPDGRRTALKGALQVCARLTITLRLVRARIAHGGTAVLMVLTQPGAGLGVKMSRPAAALTGLVLRRPQRGPGGQWRVVLDVASTARAGPLDIVVTATWNGQHASARVRITVG